MIDLVAGKFAVSVKNATEIGLKENGMLGLSLSLARAAQASFGKVETFAAADLYGVDFARGRDVGIRLGGQRPLEVWSDIGGGWINVLEHDVGAGRSSNRVRRLVRSVNYYPANALTKTGTWGANLSSPSVGSAASYCGGVSANTSTAGAYAEISVTGEGDIWVVYTGRTSAGYARVDINGSQDLVSLPATAYGVKGFDQTAAVDLTKRIPIKVATGLPAGTYTVRITNVAGPALARIYVEGVAMQQRPSLCTRLLPPLWQAGLAVVAGQELMLSTGKFVRARAAGTTAGAEPVYTTLGGVIADGGGLAYNGWDAPSWHWSEHFTDYASERECACSALVSGQTGEIGGQTHGNEVSLASAMTLDGVAVTPSAAMQWGSKVVMVDSLRWTHVAAANLATLELVRTFERGQMTVNAELTANAPAQLGWFYAAMHPGVAWDTQRAEAVFTKARFGSDSEITLTATSTANADYQASTAQEISMVADWPDVRLVSAIRTSGMPMAGLIRANVSNTVPPAEQQLKAYLSIATSEAPLTVAPGDVIRWTAVHGEAVV